MKILTFTLLASLAMGASALPAETSYQQTAIVAYAGPSSEDRDHKDTADSSDDEAVDDATLRQMHGDPQGYQNRDLRNDANRTYNQRENIESDYGKEIQREIIENRDIDRDKDGDDRDDSEGRNGYDRH